MLTWKCSHSKVRARVPEAADRVPKQEAVAWGQKDLAEAVHPPRRARVQDAQ